MIAQLGKHSIPHFFDKIGHCVLVLVIVAGILSGLELYQSQRGAQADKDTQYRLIVVGDELTLNKGELIAQTGESSLLGFKTHNEAKAAYKNYAQTAEFISYDTQVSCANEEATEQPFTQVMNKDSNPFSAFEASQELIQESDEELKSDEDSIQTDSDKLIALIDTGVPENEAVCGSANMLEENSTDLNGHATEMLECMLKINKDAHVLAIKALDKDGVGSISSVYAAMLYAINAGVKVINLSISAPASNNNEVLAHAVELAQDAGIICVCAAGNNASNVKDYTPGNLDAAFVCGACEISGLACAQSNYGDTIDAYVCASSSSYASAKTSAWIAKNAQFKDYQAKISAEMGKGLFWSRVSIENFDTQKDTDSTTSAKAAETKSSDAFKCASTSGKGTFFIYVNGTKHKVTFKITNIERTSDGVGTENIKGNSKNIISKVKVSGDELTVERDKKYLQLSAKDDNGQQHYRVALFKVTYKQPAWYYQDYTTKVANSGCRFTSKEYIKGEANNKNTSDTFVKKMYPAEKEISFKLAVWIGNAGIELAADDTTGVSSFYISYTRGTLTTTYNANNGTGATKTQTMSYNDLTTLTGNSFQTKGYTFKGWAKSASATSTALRNNASAYPNNLVTIGSNGISSKQLYLTLYAVWEASGYTVTIPTSISYQNMRVGTVETKDTYSVTTAGAWPGTLTISGQNASVSCGADSFSATPTSAASPLSFEEAGTASDAIVLSGLARYADLYSGSILYSVKLS